MANGCTAFFLPEENVRMFTNNPDLLAAKGMIIGLAIGAVMWTLLGLLGWWLWWG